MRRKLYVTFYKNKETHRSAGNTADICSQVIPEYIEAKWYETPGKALIMEGVESVTTEVTKHPIYSRLLENGRNNLLHRLMEQTIEPAIKGQRIMVHPEISGD